MRGKLVTIGVVGMLLAIVAVVPAMAGQHKVRHFATDVTIKTNQEAGRIFGKVKSDKAKCVAARKVILNVDGEDVFNARAGDDGSYGIRTSDGSPLSPGHYEVHSPRLTLSSRKVCDPGDSKIVAIN